jgi:hypothetical protein
MKVKIIVMKAMYVGEFLLILTAGCKKSNSAAFAAKLSFIDQVDHRSNNTV